MYRYVYTHIDSSNQHLHPPPSFLPNQQSTCNQMHKESHYFECSVTNNIYGTTKAADRSLLVGNKRQLVRLYRNPNLIVKNFVKNRNTPSIQFYVNNEDDNQSFIRKGGVVLNQLPLNNVPEDADIISINALPSGHMCIAFHQPSLVAGRPSNYGFNIYGIKNSSPHVLTDHLHIDWDMLVDDCQRIELNYVPFKIRHTQTYLPNFRKPVAIILLCGGDGQVHAYGPSSGIARRGYEELPIDSVMPELNMQTTNKVLLQTNLMSLDLLHTNTSRFTAVGYQNGSIILTIATTGNKSPSPSSSQQTFVYRPSFGEDNTSRYEEQLDGPIPSVHLFRTAINVDNTFFHERETYETGEKIHLLVCGALGYAIVYLDIEKNGLNAGQILDGPKTNDSILCCHLMDFNCDGVREILIGTYNGYIISYKYDFQCRKYIKYWNRKLPDSIYALSSCDFDGDGIDELLVTTRKGVHVIQADIKNAAKIVLDFLNKDVGDGKMMLDKEEYKKQQQHQQYLMNKIQNNIKATLEDFDKKAVSGVPSNQSVAWLFNR